MNFLAPLFFLGALAVVGPILFHLIRRTTREVTPFSSLLFLQPTPPRVTRRSRLENFWLLLLRCLVIAALAAAFARPLFRKAADAAAAKAGEGRRIAILLDTSASMRRGKLWEEATRHARELLHSAAPGDEFAVLAFDHRVRTVLGFDEWRQLPLDTRTATGEARIAALTPSWGNTRLDTALTTAGELLAESSQGAVRPGKIIVISDLQEGSRLDGLQAYEWPKNVSVDLFPLKADSRNAGIQWLSESEETQKSTAESAPIRVRVSNSADSRNEQLRVEWRAANGAPRHSSGVNLYVPAGQSRVVKPPEPPPGATELVLTGDASDLDNHLFVLPPKPMSLPVLFAGKDAAEDTQGLLYYLQRAFPKTSRQSVEIVTPNGDGVVQTVPGSELQLAVMGEAISEPALHSIRELVQGGRIAIVPLTSAEEGARLAALLGVPSVQLEEATVKDYALLAQIDFTHPLFAPFADPRFSDFTKIHFWKHRRIDMSTLSGARTIASFDDGAPAIVQVPLGKGSVVLLASSWKPVDSQLALSSKFLPLLQALLEQSSDQPMQRAQYFIGEEVSLPASTAAQSVLEPDGTVASVAPGTPFTGTEQPGIYTVQPGGRRFVVNLAPEESRMILLAPERLAGLGVPLSSTSEIPPAIAAERLTQAQAAEIESRQKLWRWLLAGALGALLLETLIAARLTRRLTQPQPSHI